ncbi:YIP1 family protein [Paenibacillus naphthalenovorans]|uniref:YIP1 family protein n=1 Tax=Paenibacillus naphthalenovorans TaxID=162209 RepID=UPI000885CBA3|nr:YIP1 family protein [Paenibacillus naphthalenovorans]SDI07021.1 NHL repeat-containing protein [Paenibacillus naphthalenovorans]
MKNRTLRILPFMLVISFAIGFTLPGLQASASQLPYETFYKDGFGQLVKTQAAYIPGRIIGYNEDIPVQDENADSGRPAKLQLNQPKDIFVDKQDHIYIADTGNNRIVHLDDEGAYIREITVSESPLKRPSGVFVDKNGVIYVADTGNNRIVRLDADGKLLKSFGRPESAYIPESFKYDPINLVVDKRGFLYVTTLGAYQGLVQLDPEGNFVSFFGPNQVAFSLFDAFKRFVYTREMYQRELKKLPGAIANATIDDNGFIYTVTKEIQTGQIKKLNIVGLDQLEGKSDFAELQTDRSYGEYIHYWQRDVSPQLSDITVDAAGNITVVDTVWNIISQYDTNGNLLFFWGGDVITATSKTGVVKTPAAIAGNSKGELLVLDSTNNLIQALRPSEFGELVHKANALTQEGRYEESEPLWNEVRRLNAQYSPALIGLAKAAYKKEDYKRAEELFYQAGVVGGYSESFWQNRLIWFQKRFGLLMNIAIGFGILYLIWARVSRRLRPKKGWGFRFRLKSSLVERLKHVFYLMKHPIDGFYAIRYEGKADFASSLILLALAVAAFGYMQSGTSFMFNPAIHVGVDLLPLTVQFVGIWLGWVISNYLISSLLRGEGRFRDVFFSSSYALFPIILIGIPVTLLSNTLTLNELAIFNFLKLTIFVWIALLTIWMVQGIHNYTFIEALFIILLSLLTLVIIIILIFIFISLSIELVNFIYSLYQEVFIR